MRSDSENEGYAPIEGATDKTYTLSEADAGKWIKVKQQEQVTTRVR